MNAYRFNDLAVGMWASFSHVLTTEDVDRFADLSGDRNPLHVDDAYARSTDFGRRVVHGMYLGALLSRLIGMHLPGRYALYLAQSLDFSSPGFVGDEVAVRGVITTKHDALRAVTMDTRVERGAMTLVRGRATVRLLE